MSDSEIALLIFFGSASACALVVPLARFFWILRKEAFPRVVVVRDQSGAVIGEISAESVQQTDNGELARLHERIRRSKHVSVEAA
jgi:hypothetical protein